MALPLDSGKGNWSIAEINANFKPTFEGRAKTLYNTHNPLEGAIKKKYNFTGKEKNIETHLSFAGGFGARLLPKANNSKMENQKITSKKVYGRALVDREGIKAASSSQGAYQRYLKFPTQKCVENYVNQCARITFGDGTGILGKGDAATNISGNGSEATPFIVTISAASFKDVNFEEKAFVQVVTGLNAANAGGSMEGGDNLTNILEVVKVDVPNRKVHLVGASAVLVAGAPMAATTGLCMQRSYNGEPTGLGKILMAQDGDTFQGIDIQRRWKAGQLNANGSGLLTDMINEMFLERSHVFGEEMDMIVCRYNQYQKLLAQLEEKKSIQITNKNLKGHLGFSGIEYVTSTGKTCAIVTNRFADADKVYMLNSKYIERLHRPDFGWFDEDGTVFLRTSEDEYEARYGGYWEHVAVPTAHAVIHGLAL